MRKPWLVLVDGKLWARKLTEHGAKRVQEKLKDSGLPATVAYEREGQAYEPYFKRYAGFDD